MPPDKRARSIRPHSTQEDSLSGLSLLLSFLGLCGLPGRLTASCICVPGPALTSRPVVQATTAKYDAIMDGVIIEVSYFRAPRPSPQGEFPLDEILATVVVNRRWRGVGSDTVVVRTPAGTAACGISFEESQRYLLFAEKEEGRLYAHKCGPSRLWDQEADRLTTLLGPENRGR